MEGEGSFLAFPNAYVSTDEPPGRSWKLSALCLLAMAGVGYLGAVILLLSLVTKEYSPVTQVASDYGVGTYSLAMNAGFFFAGIAVISLAAAILTSSRQRVQRVGAILLLLSGLMLLTNAFFQTDIEGAVSTLHGTVHGLAGVVFFIASPIGLLLVNRSFGRVRFVLTFAAFALGYGFVLVNSVAGLDAAGLSERIVILFVFSSLILTAAKVYNEA